MATVVIVVAITASSRTVTRARRTATQMIPADRDTTSQGLVKGRNGRTKKGGSGGGRMHPAGARYASKEARPNAPFTAPVLLNSEGELPWDAGALSVGCLCVVLFIRQGLFSFK